MKFRAKKLFIVSSLTLTGLFLAGMLTLTGIYAYLAPKLPDIDTLKDVQLQVPLRVFSKEGKLIAEFGEMKRSPLDYNEFPPLLIKAILAAEDYRFFEHPGVDYQGILRAAVNLLRTGERSQGGSTITMQVARNFFLSSEKTFLRKFSEIFLSLKIENEITKQDILALYLNKIYLGKRAYGFAAAAEVYYGKSLQELSLPQLAMVAGLPKAPSRYNPVVNPERAILRRDYVLGRMHDLKFISSENYELAKNTLDDASVYSKEIEAEAPYVAEMVRSEVVKYFGDIAYTAGLQVYTTIDAKLQTAANQALRDSLLAYERRHGYRGTESHIDPFTSPLPDDMSSWDEVLAKLPTINGLQSALVFDVDEQSVYAYTDQGNVAYIPWEKLNWARRYIADNHLGPELEKASDVLKIGDIIRITPKRDGCTWLAQIPKVGGAIVSLHPDDGSVLALSGGFDFYQSKFNRVIQAKRQPGSSFKPFIYTAALDKGYTAASIINDAPVVFDAPGLEDTWRPENYSGKFFGPTRLRQALTKSRNLVSIRLLRDIGIGYAVRYVTRFGFRRADLPRDLSLALGSGALTPMEVATGYTVFANNGHRVQPYFVDRILGPDNELVLKANPVRVCRSCPEPDEEQTNDDNSKTESSVSTESDTTNIAAEPTAAIPAPAITINKQHPLMLQEKYWDGMENLEGPPALRRAERVLSPQTAFLANTMLRDVILYGTGRRALQLQRKDLAGKTGTTNDQRDAWFSGFNRNVVTISWVGFDNPKPLGNNESGAIAALPMWIDYMRVALHGMEETPLEQPPGLISMRIDATTGLPTQANNRDTIFEYFRADRVPQNTINNNSHTPALNSNTPENITEQLF